MAIEIKNISKSYRKNQILSHFTMTLERDKILCLFGPSGCGKTTLLNILAGTVQSDFGEVIGKEKMTLSYVFQEERLLPWCTVRENLEFVLKGKFSKKDTDEKITEVLRLVNLEKYQNAYPNELSGGMRQRVALARAFAYGGDILAMDEPFKGLHLELKYVLMDYVIQYWHQFKPYMIFITHDPDEALYIADKLYILSGPPLKIEKKLSIEVPHELRKSNPEFLWKYYPEIGLRNYSNSGPFIRPGIDF